MGAATDAVRNQPESRASARGRGAGRPVARVEGYAPIAEYAAIGDGRTIALVARDGSIDWLPLPAIDQATVFGALLDAEQGGTFRLAPEEPFEVSRRYLPHTNVLETTYTTDAGALRVTDALNLQDGGLLPWVELVRCVQCVKGEVPLRWDVEPRFGNGCEETTLDELGGMPVALGQRLRLAVLAWDLGAPLRSDSCVSGSLVLSEGESGLLACLAVDQEPIPQPSREEIEIRLKGTRDSWKRWVKGQTYDGPWSDEVERSALALKLLIYAPSGAITAAGTSALPEKIGGSRNFDYRFSWIRDSAFALDALTRLGLREQVHGSLSWLLDATSPTHPRLQPLYALDGHIPRGVEQLPLAGYRGSQPVERGNDAAGQLQLGCYGDLFETVWHYVREGNTLEPPTATRLAENANLVCEIWQNDDSGLWELGQHRPYTISKMSCWLALTRAADLAEEGQLPSQDTARWQQTAEQIKEFVESRCWSEKQQSYSFYAGSDDLDCAVLLAARFGFADPRGERMNATIDALLREQRVDDSPLFYRYTGMEGEEGAFLACSFWMVTALARAGRLDEARSLMNDLLPLANDVGLWSEEIDPRTHELLGNYPQALTHLSLINAAAAVADAENEKGSDEQ